MLTTCFIYFLMKPHQHRDLFVIFQIIMSKGRVGGGAGGGVDKQTNKLQGPESNRRICSDLKIIFNLDTTYKSHSELHYLYFST
jgi:hypothetical protein